MSFRVGERERWKDIEGGGDRGVEAVEVRYEEAAEESALCLFQFE